MKVIFEPDDFESIPVHSDPEILGGTPVFVGTRVPVDALWNNLSDGATLDEFLNWFPTVTRQQAEAVIRYVHNKMAVPA
jgi:uncharacterized protein (DUF433 family)